jgi:hypothetical protein
MPDTGTDSPQNASGSVMPKRPLDAPTSGSTDPGTCSKSHSSGDHASARMS